MTIQHTNRKGHTFYLHQGTTKTGKPKYFFSRKSEGVLLEHLPEGFEVYENPNAQVFLRRIPPRLITDEERALVEQGLKQLPRLKYLIDVKQTAIIIYEADQDPERLLEILSLAPGTRTSGAEAFLAQALTYSPVLQFVLVDAEARRFAPERYCYLGSIEDWIVIGDSDELKKLLKKYLKHLGRDSFFSLF